MAFCSLQDTFIDHYKFKKLAAKIGKDNALLIAQATMVRLWCWCLRHHPDGTIPTKDSTEAEDAVQWVGKPGELLPSLAECGFLDNDGNGSYEIHNWLEHGGSYHERKRKQEWRKKKLSQEVPSVDVKSRELTDAFLSFPFLSSPLVSSDLNTKKEDIKDSSILRSSSLDRTSLVQEVFQHYKKHHPKSSASSLPVMSEEYRAIDTMLQSGFTVEDCKKAIDGYHSSQFHKGKNELKQKCLGIELIFRDTSHVTKGIEMADDPLSKVNCSEKETKSLAAAEGWLKRMENEDEQK